MISIICPSRGLIYSKTVESIINGMKHLNGLGLATSYFSSHDMPIPDGHHYCVAQALQNNAKRIIIVEEDMYIFPDGYQALASSTTGVATMPYNDKNGSPHGIVHYDEAGNLLWGGLGATSVDAELFRKMGEPYFRTNVMYKNIKKHLKDGKMVTEYVEMDKKEVWDEGEMKFVKKEDHYKYGGLDIDFYTRARKLGATIEVLQGHKAVHFDLVQLGDRYTNNGCHIIRTV